MGSGWICWPRVSIAAVNGRVPPPYFLFRIIASRELDIFAFTFLRKSHQITGEGPVQRAGTYSDCWLNDCPMTTNERRSSRRQCFSAPARAVFLEPDFAPRPTRETDVARSSSLILR